MVNLDRLSMYHRKNDLIGALMSNPNSSLLHFHFRPSITWSTSLVVYNDRSTNSGLSAGELFPVVHIGCKSMVVMPVMVP